MASNATDLHAHNLTANEGQDSGSEYDSDYEIPFPFEYRARQEATTSGHNANGSKHQVDGSKVKKEPDALDRRGAEIAKKKEAKKGKDGKK